MCLGNFLKCKRRAANLDSLHSKIRAIRPAILQPHELHCAAQFWPHHPEMYKVTCLEKRGRHGSKELFPAYRHTAISKLRPTATDQLVSQIKTNTIFATDPLRVKNLNFTDYPDILLKNSFIASPHAFLKHLPGMTFPSFHRPKCPCLHRTIRFRKTASYQWRTGHRPWLAIAMVPFYHDDDVPFHGQALDTYTNDIK